MKEYRLDDFKNKIIQNELLRPLDILLVGATGVGKSSTINALFGEEVAKVGYGVDPETKDIKSFSFHDYLRLHDSAGLGDGKEADIIHIKNIISKLLDKCNIGDAFMDLVLVLLDGGSRDLGTSFNLFEQAVLKNIDSDRVIVAINQADMGMKGRSWNSAFNFPNDELKNILEDKAISVQRRIKESIGINISKPIYYSAKHNYNIEALYTHIIQHIPKKRRFAVTN